MKFLAFALVGILLIAGCVGQTTQTPTGAAVADKPVVTETKQITQEPVNLPPGEVATCKEVYDAATGETILDCG